MDAGALFETYATPIAIVFSATAAIVVAAIGWYVNRKLARESAALSLILERQRETRTEARAVALLLFQKVNVAELVEHLPVGKDGATWEAALPETSLPTEQKQHLHISRLLSFYEAVAVAITEKIVDERTIKRFLINRFCWHIENLYPFILAARGNENIGGEDTWIELEELARRWGATLPEPPRQHKNWLEKVVHKATKRLSNLFSSLTERTAPRRRG